MERIVINGGKPLNGEIEVSGMKNAALPILMGCLLVEDKCIIENLTDASINCEEGYTLTSDYKCQKITYHEPIKKAE